MTFRTTQEESALIRKAARERRVALTEWMRSALLRGAQRVLRGR